MALCFLFSCKGEGQAKIEVTPSPEPVPSHTHAFSDWAIEKYPTCTESGALKRSCSCGETHTVPVKKTAHSFGKWMPDPSLENGICTYETRACSCGEKQTRLDIISIPKILLSRLFKNLFNFIFDDFTAAPPNIDSVFETKVSFNTAGDIYVSSRGNDNGYGTLESPFLTIERAKKAVSEMDKSERDSIIVCIEAGEYRVSSLSFSGSEGGSPECPVIYRAVGGEVIINGGVSLSQSDFKPVSHYPEIAERLSAEAKSRVMVIDLSAHPYYLTENDYGKIYPIGTYNTADRYGGDTTGPIYSELFVNGERQSLARYPDTGYIQTGEVIVSGRESGDRAENGDPSGDVYRLTGELAERVSSWETVNDVWAYGFWMYDWADGSSPIASFDKLCGELTLKYQSFFGAREGAPYYFYNCLEELTTEGEWYLDRQSGLLCLYAPKNMQNAEINLSLSTSPVINIAADNIILDGLTVQGSRSDGIVANGNGITVSNSRIKNLAGLGIYINGYNNTVIGNEVAHTGRGGISMVGGDRATLTHGNNVAKNNLIHDWSEIFETYQAGIDLGGVGNLCSNNEIFNSPHLAITYDGNFNVIEYNLIHDVCLETDDAGAIYAGRTWVSYGNHVRYNCIYNIGSEDHIPDGIYMDDAISGQNIYGNLLINIPKYGIFIGGGRDMSIYGNVIINSGECAIRYDSRARDGVLGETWFSEHVAEGRGDLWLGLYSSPWQSEIWQNAFPEYKNAHGDFSRKDDVGFFPNPSNSVIGGNLTVDKNCSVGKIDGAVLKYSKLEKNAAFNLALLDELFGNPDKGDYSIKRSSPVYTLIPDFAEIPLNKIGIKQ